MASIVRGAMVVQMNAFMLACFQNQPERACRGRGNEQSPDGLVNHDKPSAASARPQLSRVALGKPS